MVSIAVFSICTMVECAKRHGHNPEAWLTEVLERLPAMSNQDDLISHSHLHVLAANRLFTPDGDFHCMPAEDLDPAIELFRHRFLHALRDAKLINPGKLADLLS